ncbi:MAG: 2TM domain-containing protein [Flavobacterium sp.]
MEQEQHELYEYARTRIAQKKWLYYHFVILLLGVVFLYVANKWLSFYPETDWWVWAATVWAFLFVFHAIKVHVLDSFMNKEWERTQINKLIAMQSERIEQLKNDLNNSKNTD